MHRFIAKAGTAVVAAGALAGCAGGANVPTCAEYAKMGPDTGLLVSATAKQEKTLKELLLDRGYSDDALNVSMAHSQVIAYCNIYAGVSSGNQNLLIDGIPGLQ